MRWQVWSSGRAQAGKALTYLGHLWMTEVLVHNHALDQFSVLQPPAHFAFYFDELKVNVSAFHICHSEDGVHCNLGHLAVTAVNPDESKQNQAFTFVYQLLQPKQNTMECGTQIQHTSTQRQFIKLMLSESVEGNTPQAACSVA